MIQKKTIEWWWHQGIQVLLQLLLVLVLLVPLVLLMVLIQVPLPASFDVTWMWCYPMAVWWTVKIHCNPLLFQQRQLQRRKIRIVHTPQKPLQQVYHIYRSTMCMSNSQICFRLHVRNAPVWYIVRLPTQERPEACQAHKSMMWTNNLPTHSWYIYCFGAAGAAAGAFFLGAADFLAGALTLAGAAFFFTTFGSPPLAFLTVLGLWGLAPTVFAFLVVTFLGLVVVPAVFFGAAVWRQQEKAYVRVWFHIFTGSIQKVFLTFFVVVLADFFGAVWKKQEKEYVSIWFHMLTRRKFFPILTFFFGAVFFGTFATTFFLITFRLAGPSLYDDFTCKISPVWMARTRAPFKTCFLMVVCKGKTVHMVSLIV